VKLLPKLIVMGLACVPFFCMAAVAKPTRSVPAVPRVQAVSPRPSPRVVSPRTLVVAPASRRSGVTSGSGPMPGVLGGPVAQGAKMVGVVQGTGMKHRR